MKNQRALVTGATRGIGRCIAEMLLEQGAHVILSGSKAPDSPWWPADASCEFIAADLASEKEVDHLIKQVKNRDVSMLVNNAGRFASSEDWDRDIDTFRNLCEVNLLAPARLVYALAPEMGRRGGGRIVNIGSIAGLVARKGSAAYASSKHGLAALTRSAALDFADGNVLVNSVCPAYVDTDMLHTLSPSQRQELLEKIPLKRFCTVQDVAHAVRFLLSEENRFITGHSLVVDGGVLLS